MQTLKVKGLPRPPHDFELIPSRAETYHSFLKTTLLKLICKIILSHVQSHIYSVWTIEDVQHTMTKTDLLVLQNEIILRASYPS